MEKIKTLSNEDILDLWDEAVQTAKNPIIGFAKLLIKSHNNHMIAALNRIKEKNG